MQKIGINYSKLYMRNAGIFSPYEFFEYLANLKFKNLYVQLGAESYQFLLNKSDLEKIRNYKEKYGFEVAIHFPETIPMSDRKFDVLFPKILHACKFLSSRYLVVHFPITQTPQDSFIRKKLKFVEPIELNICLENVMEGGYYSRIDNIINFIKKNPEFGITFDPGHLNFILKNNLQQFSTDVKKLEEVSNKVKVIHAHLNDGTKDLHLPVYPERTGSNQFYFLVKQVIKRFSSSLIIEESYPRSETHLKNMVSCLRLISRGEI